MSIPLPNLEGITYTVKHGIWSNKDHHEQYDTLVNRILTYDLAHDAAITFCLDNHGFAEIWIKHPKYTAKLKHFIWSQLDGQPGEVLEH